MKFMILVKSNPDLEKTIDEMSDSAMKESIARMEAFNDELKKAGLLKDCDGLRPSREGKRVRFDGESRSVIDGPFEGDTPFERAVGTITDAIDALTIERAIDAHLDGPETSISYGH